MRGAVITVDALNLDAAKPFLDLAQAAMRADRLRRERAAALKERQETICVHEEEPDPDSRRPGIGPCWKGGYSDPLSGEWEHQSSRGTSCSHSRTGARTARSGRRRTSFT